jgi:hypothetical protein
MKIRDVVDGQSRERCRVEKVEAPKKSVELFGDIEGGKDYEWLLCKFKPMGVLLVEYGCYFDKYGNLCSNDVHLAPSFFKYLGETVHVKVGCGFSLPESDWLKYEM